MVFPPVLIAIFDSLANQCMRHGMFLHSSSPLLLPGIK
jgi:hypothetical protein